MTRRVLIAQFAHETNTFSRLPTTLEDYRRRWLLEGDEIAPRFRGTRTEIGGLRYTPLRRGDRRTGSPAGWGPLLRAKGEEMP